MYSLIENNINVGLATVKREGLYYLFKCSCVPKNKGIHRIFACDGTKKVDLGICVPEKDAFVLKTRVPIKKLEGGVSGFLLVSEGKNKVKIPIHSDMRFDLLEKISAARLLVSNGQQMLVIDQSQDR